MVAYQQVDEFLDVRLVECRRGCGVALLAGIDSREGRVAEAADTDSRLEFRLGSRRSPHPPERARLEMRSDRLERDNVLVAAGSSAISDMGQEGNKANLRTESVK